MWRPKVPDAADSCTASCNSYLVVLTPCYDALWQNGAGPWFASDVAKWWKCKRWGCVLHPSCWSLSHQHLIWRNLTCCGVSLTVVLPFYKSRKPGTKERPHTTSVFFTPSIQLFLNLDRVSSSVSPESVTFPSSVGSTRASSSKPHSSLGRWR